MKLFELLAHLRLWPFDTELKRAMHPGGKPGDDSHDDWPVIVLPKGVRPVAVQPARWPTEYERRTRH